MPSSSYQKEIVVLFGLIVMDVIISESRFRIITEHHQSFVMWVIKSVVFNGLERILVCCFWILMLILLVIFLIAFAPEQTIDDEGSKGGGGFNGWRKFFHVLSVVMFTPTLILDCEMVEIGLGMVLIAMTALEVVRPLFPNALSLVTTLFKSFAGRQDNKSGHIIVTHLGLMAGIVSPSWLSSPLSINRTVLSHHLLVFHFSHCCC